MAAYFLTRYLLPIGDRLHFAGGIHMLPEYVAQEHFAVWSLLKEGSRADR